jgi:tetratricopeptide (TPR) repeat protein
MSNGARYRQQARGFEQRENWKRAIEAYELAVESDELAGQAVDLALYNRIGDLYRRIGDVNKAVDYYDKAADGHLSAGLYNNAIALCNKILRNQPNRHSAYLKLGKVGAAKGFLSDARRHFLEYAERMQKAGQLDEAFKALVEFADISPDPEVRLMIAEQLIGHDRTMQAVDQMRLAWLSLSDEGREADAKEIRDRIVGLAPNRDPEVDPPTAGATSGLGAEVDAEGILELPEILPYDDEPEPAAKGPAVTKAVEEPEEVEIVTDGPELADIEVDELGLDDLGGDEIELDSIQEADLEVAGYGAGELGTSSIDTPDIELDGFEATSIDVNDSKVGDVDVELEGIDLESVQAGFPDDGPGIELTTDGLELEPTTLVDEEGEPALEDLEEAFATDLEPAIEVEEETELPPITPPTPAERVAMIEARISVEGRQPGLLVEMAEALLETGGRDKATFCLGEAVDIYQQQGEYRDAYRVLEEMLRLDVNDVSAYQKQVELALKAADRNALIDAYLGLADCLDRTDAGNKAVAVYSRVLELDPQNPRAAAAIEMLGPEPAASAGDSSDGKAAGDYVDLGSLVADHEEEKSTRFIVPTSDPESEADVNFSEMLSQFKSKVAENIEEEDATSHYDLGVAFKEMGLIDEAIAEFQIAARGMEYRLRAIEMLGSCFLEKEDFRIALKVLGRALQVRDYKDEDLVGVFYAMGKAYEALGEIERALEWYERVLGCDVSFKDVSDRVASLRE